MTNASRLMVRYTQEKWENGAPNLQSNLYRPVRSYTSSEKSPQV